MKTWMILMFTAVFAAGCSLAPEYRQPRQDIPDSWCEPAPKKEPSVLDCAAPEVEYASLSRQWWKRFQDKALDALIEKALARNRDIEQGLARVDSARAMLLSARGELFPSFSGQGNGTRSRPSLDTSETQGLARELGELESRVGRLEGAPFPSPHAPSRTGTVWSGAVQAVWELDIWGRWRNTASAAQKSLLSAEESQKALELSVAGRSAPLISIS
ncbi:MAG: TolC family protein [Mailhella sp.]|nr:TolC family protein [Mailhella sp.]